MSTETPAALVVRLFGGAKVVQEICHLKAVTQVRRWNYPADRGGLEGRVPARHHATLLAAAKLRDLPLTPKDLMPWLDAPAEEAAWTPSDIRST